MAKVYTLSNGQMLVGVDKYNLVHDCYYPFVGYENHNSARTSRHKIGIMVDGNFSWLDEDSNWQHDAKLHENGLVGLATSVNSELGIKIEFTDFVDCQQNVFVRKVRLTNTGSTKVQLKIFFHQVFQIAESFRGDTAVFLPDEKAILDYKGNRAIVAALRYEDGTPQDQYSIGNHGIEGKEGTYRDAEDGELSGNNVEHGYVDSVLRLSYTLQPSQSEYCQYWLTFGSDNVEAIDIHTQIQASGIDKYLKRTLDYWGEWLGSLELSGLNKDYRQAAITNALYIKSHIDKRGAVLASCDSSMLNYARDYYSYFWPRDAAYAIRPLVRLGLVREPMKLFELCEDLITKKGYLEHKYLPNGALASSWHPRIQDFHSELPVQEDETASMVIAIYDAYKRSENKEDFEHLYKNFIQPACNWMTGFIDIDTGLPHGSYDLWEQKFLVNTYTVGVVYGALTKASKMAEAFNHNQDVVSWGVFSNSIKSKYLGLLWSEDINYFIKGYRLHTDGSSDRDKTIDISSLYGLVKFGLLGTDSREFKAALKTVEDKLLDRSPSGGVVRFENDNYYQSKNNYPGNPWIVSSLWLAQLYIMIGRNKQARSLLMWSLELSGSAGTLPEQIDPEDSSHLSVEPLTWSHAEVLQTMIDLDLGIDY